MLAVLKRTDLLQIYGIVIPTITTKLVKVQSKFGLYPFNQRE
jgi:hypothetical protein